MQQNGPVGVMDAIDESAGVSWIDAMVQRVEVGVSATSLSEDAIQPPARVCARVDVGTVLFGID
ncbi:MAG: hypothetical protein ACK6A7_07125, partial [Planctomycetota bacterium]